MRTSEQIIQALTEAKERKARVILDNDTTHAYTEEGEPVFRDIGPDDMLQALLEHFGNEWDYA